MERVERKHYADGSLQEETHYLGSALHGPWRKWYPNGLLEFERFMANGKRHGPFKSWYPTGTPECDNFWLEDKAFGRLRAYRPDGSLLWQQYALNGRPVSRAKYEEACKTRPELPRYHDADPPPKTRKRTRSNPRLVRTEPDLDEVARHENFVTEMLAKRNAEARSWLEGASADSFRNLGEMSDDESIALVERLYELSAVGVLAVEIEDDADSQGQTTNHLLVQLPEDPAKRESLFEFIGDHAEDEGFDRDRDFGQEYLYMKLA